MERSFSIGQVSSLFFDRNTQWLRWMVREGRVVGSNGEEIGSRKANSKLGGGDRAYSLDDVSAIADTLKVEGYLDDDNRKKVDRRIQSLKDPVYTGKHRQ